MIPCNPHHIAIFIELASKTLAVSKGFPAWLQRTYLNQPDYDGRCKVANLIATYKGIGHHDPLDRIGLERRGALCGPIDAGWRDWHRSGNATAGLRLAGATPTARNAQASTGPAATAVLKSSGKNSRQKKAGWKFGTHCPISGEDVGLGPSQPHNSFRRRFAG